MKFIFFFENVFFLVNLCQKHNILISLNFETKNIFFEKIIINFEIKIIFFEIIFFYFENNIFILRLILLILK